jgi:purine-nucleoside phosphorylase
VQSWSKEGYFGIEMETATVFAVSKHFNVPSASLMHVGDNLIKGQTAGDESHNLEKNQREELKKYVHKIAIETVLNI